MGRGIQKDLKIGKKAEELVKNAINNKFGLQLESNLEHRTKHYDLICIKTGQTFEVKYDKYATKSSNVALEYFNPKQNKPSGITLTTAKFWAHVFDNPLKIYICTVKNLLKFVEEEHPLRIVERCGDNNSSIFLYKMDVIIEKCFYDVDKIKSLSEII